MVYHVFKIKLPSVCKQLYWNSSSKEYSQQSQNALVFSAEIPKTENNAVMIYRLFLSIYTFKYYILD